MNAELKAKWVAALRSGDYEQGTCRLRNSDDTYCCLGVLCDVSGLGTWRMLTSPGEWSNVYCIGEQAFPFGLVGSPLDDEIGGHWDDLIEMNDSGGKTFSEIADYIEENL